MSKRRLSEKSAPNRITEVVHKTAQGLYQAGVLDQTTTHEFDALCLPEVPDYSETRSDPSVRIVSAANPYLRNT